MPDQYSPSDGVFSYFSSSADYYLNQHLMPPPLQGVNINDYVRESSSMTRTSSRFVEGTSRVPESVGSLSSRSDDSEYEPASKTHASSRRSFSSCYSFMSKPIHPFTENNASDEDDSYVAVASSSLNNSLHSDMRQAHASTDFHSPASVTFGKTPRRKQYRRSGNSSVDSADGSESFGRPHKNINGGSRCGLCDRHLSQRSPWGSRRMVWSGDMPTASVLACWHVFHAECLDRITPKPQNHDPHCPVCEKLGNVHGVEQWAICRLKNGLPKLRSLGEEEPSRVWSCGQAGDCVGARWSGSISLRNRGRHKTQLTVKGNSGKERIESSKRSGLCSPRMSLGAVGCSSLVPGPALNRW